MKSCTPLLTSLLMILTLAGCSPRNVPLPDVPVISREEVSALYGVEREWWKAYGDPQLNGLVDRALMSNIDLARSAISVNRALYQARALGAELVPEFSASTNAGSTLDTTSGDSSRSYGGSLSISYEVDLWGRLRNAASAQAWEYMATTEDMEAARLALINNIINTYYNLMYLQEALEVSRQGLAFYEEIYRITENKHEVGSVDGLEPVTARQSLLAERNTILNLENQLKVAEQTLRDLLNMGPEEPLNLAHKDLMSTPLPPVDLNVPVAALGLRPDVQAAEYRLQEAYDSLGAQRASLYPSITVGGSLSVSSNEADTFFDVPLLGGTVRLNFPFLQWNRVRWNVRSAEAGLEDAQLVFIQRVTTALNEIDTYYYAYQTALRQLDNAQAKLETDSQITFYRKNRYDAGVDELRLWLQARNTEINSALAVLQSKYTVIQNENAIYQAMGGRLTTRW